MYIIYVYIHILYILIYVPSLPSFFSFLASFFRFFLPSLLCFFPFFLRFFFLACFLPFFLPPSLFPCFLPSVSFFPSFLPFTCFSAEKSRTRTCFFEGKPRKITPNPSKTRKLLFSLGKPGKARKKDPQKKRPKKTDPLRFHHGAALRSVADFSEHSEVMAAVMHVRNNRKAFAGMNEILDIQRSEFSVIFSRISRRAD